MESRFSHDFGQVRIHTDLRAAESAAAVGAMAYTVGRDVVFGAGQYAPGTGRGQALLAHELVHVVQQESSAATFPARLQIERPDAVSEREAVRVAEAVASAADFQLSGAVPTGDTLQRACGPAAIGRVSDCIGLGGQDITDVGFSSADLFLFRVGCDEFRSGEEARLRDRARSILPTDTVDIHGFASEEGNAAFNDDLSCARAHAAEGILHQEGVTSPMTLYNHGATPGVREDRRSVVLAIRSTVAEPENCSELIDDCEFYLCRERRHPCGVQGYYQGYGYKYCERFSRLLRPRLSRPGQRWVDQTRRCLMEYIDRHVPLDAPCDRVKRLAFDSHPECYVRGGVCFLDPSEWSEILGIIDPADNDLRQMIVTGVYCIGNWVPMAFPVHSLSAGGGYRGLMERDRRRAFGF
jgi:outer membrane protein OmpA-like peptidoglycan-associated protein